MSIFQNMIRKLRDGGTAGGAALDLAAFGKHPAWNDHTPDLGVESQALVDLKRTLYRDGIGGNIDSGAWEQAKHELIPFHHAFLFFTRQDWFIGRLWASQDGKGRGAYPFVVVAHVHGVSFDDVGPAVSERLRRLEQDIIGITAQDTLISAFEKTRRELRDEVRSRSAGARARPPASPLADLAAHADMGEDGVGMYRLLYRIEREMADLRKPSGTGTRMLAPPRSHHLRVPRCAEDTDVALARWGDLLRLEFGLGTPRWVFCAEDVSHVDLIVGPSPRSEFFCLRASEADVPLTTGIPYQLDEQFITRTRQRIANVP